MIVTDASAVGAALVEKTARGEQVRERFRGERFIAPDLLPVEVTSLIRGLHLGRHITEAEAVGFIGSLRRFPVHLRAPARLLPRTWGLRSNLTTYDALYVALAELLHVPLVTTDARIAKAPGIRCDVEVITGR